MNISQIMSQNHTARPAATSNSNSTSNNSGTNIPSNQLNGNSFITLLTAQLQAQDPTNPMDPNQMVNELVSINSLQQLVQIQNDLSGGAGASATSGSTGASANVQQAISPSPSYHDAVMQQHFFPAASPANS
jgi:flagellar basal-body rod modification protein FlgD